MGDLLKDMEYCIKYSTDYYRFEFINWLSNICPIVDGGRGMVITGDCIKEDEIIKEHTQRLQLINKSFASNEEIEKMFLLLLKSLLDEFIGKYVHKQEGKEVILLTLYAFKESNSLFSSVLLSNIYGESMKFNHSLLQLVSDTLSNYKKDNNKLDVFKEIEGLLAKDKYGIEVLIESIIDYTPSEGTIDFNNFHSNIAKYVRDIGNLITLKDFVISNLLSSTTIFCNPDGNLIVEMEHDDVQKVQEINTQNIEWLEKKENDKFIVNEKYHKRLNHVIKVRLGLNEEEITELFNMIGKEKSTWQLWKMEGLEKYFLKFNEYNLDDIRKFIDVLTRYPETFNINRFLDSKRNSRISRKCIIPILDDFCIFSDNVLMEVLSYLMIDVYDRTFYEGELKKRVEKILGDIDISFEIEVLTKLLTFDDVKVKHSLHKIKNTEICSPNEIDLLLIHNHDIFVIECKNFIFKSDLKAINNELMKMKKSISYKLKTKIDFVNKNLELILNNEFDIHDNIAEYKIHGIIITNKFSISSAYKDLSYDSINYTQVLNYFGKKLNKE